MTRPGRRFTFEPSAGALKGPRGNLGEKRSGIARDRDQRGKVAGEAIVVSGAASVAAGGAGESVGGSSAGRVRSHPPGVASVT